MEHVDKMQELTSQTITFTKSTQVVYYENNGQLKKYPIHTYERVTRKRASEVLDFLGIHYTRVINVLRENYVYEIPLEILQQYQTNEFETGKGE